MLRLRSNSHESLDYGSRKGSHSPGPSLLYSITSTTVDLDHQVSGFDVDLRVLREGYSGLSDDGQGCTYQGTQSPEDHRAFVL